uniref:Uncharacterized protein n=1 Tax=Arundo donax TaxID=35708 RepID=A0A0A9HAG3_ARUDO
MPHPSPIFIFVVFEIERHWFGGSMFGVPIT